VKRALSGPRWLASDQYKLLIKVGGDFSQTTCCACHQCMMFWPATWPYMHRLSVGQLRRSESPTISRHSVSKFRILQSTFSHLPKYSNYSQAKKHDWTDGTDRTDGTASTINDRGRTATGSTIGQTDGTRNRFEYAKMQNYQNCLKLIPKHGQMICTLFELEMPQHIGLDWHCKKSI